MKRLFLFVVAIVATLSLYAQPKQTIISVAVAPENVDWQYECGDDVTFNLSVNKAGIPMKDAQIYYEISEDMQTPHKKGNMTIEDGTMKINAGSMKRPGFLRLRVWATHEGKRYLGTATAGFDIDKIEPTTTMPKDFDAFWAKALADNNKLEMLPELELVPEKCTPKVKVYSASFQNLRNGCRMYGT
ncbi:MAG: acetylxylan esterase, partial [Alistipes sp.]|nr:acetylxylan esterase [Alistipes sp.]